MSQIFSTLTPVFALIAAGLLFRRAGFLKAEFWPSLTQLTYYILLPALLVSKISAADVGNLAIGALILSVVLTIIIVTLLILGLNRWLGYSGPVITSILQGGIRVNTYVGLATAATLLGDEGLAAAALIHAVWVLTVNVICVGALTVYGGKGVGKKEEGMGSGEAGAGKRGQGVGSGLIVTSLVAMARNPLILACGVGLAINGSGVLVPVAVLSVFSILGQGALPMGLLLVGAGLGVENLVTKPGPIVVAGLAKLVIMPAVVWLLITNLNLGGTVAVVLTVIASLPSSASSYVLAQKMGGDAELMAGILTVETVVAVVTMPLVLGLIL